MRGGVLGLVIALTLLGTAFIQASESPDNRTLTAIAVALREMAPMQEVANHRIVPVPEGSGTSHEPEITLATLGGSGPEVGTSGVDSRLALLHPVSMTTRSVPVDGQARPAFSDVAPTGAGGVGPMRSAATPDVVEGLGTPETAGSQEFQGLTSDCGSCDWVPPDVQVAAGPSYVVEMVNLGGAIYMKQGQRISTFDLYSWPFSFPSSDAISDPKVIYDSSSGRWFATMMDVTAGYFEVAVSDSSDPTAGWYYYIITGTPSGDFPDQPTLGVSSNVLAVGANDYTISGEIYQGGQIWVINKAQLVSGGYTYWAWWGPSCGFLCIVEFSIHPVRSLSSTSTQYFVSTSYGSTSMFTLYSVAGTPPGTVTVSSQDLPIYPLTDPPAALQAGSANTLDSGDGRVMDTVWSRGNLWASFVDSCTFSGDTEARSCLRLIEVNTVTPSVTIDQDWGYPGVYYLYPALSLDSQGDMTVIVGYSSSTDYPGLMITGQAYNEPNSLQPAAVLDGLSPSGPATYPLCSGNCRYGDYFGASTDPDGTGVWVAGEYGAAGTLWSTYVARAETRPLSASGISPSHASTDVGQTVTFSAMASGGTGSYGYTWSGLPTGCADGGQASVTCSTGAAGSFSISVVVTDSYGTTATSPALPFTVYTDPVVTEPTASPASGGIDVGQVVAFSTTVSGGSGGYSFTWWGLPGCPSQSLETLACNASQAGSFSVSVSVTDSNGFGVSSSAVPYVVLSDQMVTAPALSRTSLDVGQSLNGSVTATGGAGSFSYRWNGLPPGCAGSTAIVSCSPSIDGVYNVSVTVTDANHFAVTSSVVQVTVSPRLTVTLGADPSTFLQGHATTMNALVLGGLPPFSYEWSNLPSGCATPTKPTNYTCVPSEPGTYRITVVVHDQNAAIINSTMQIAVEPSFFGVLPLVAGYALVAGVITATVGVAGFLVLRRRRRAKQP